MIDPSQKRYKGELGIGSRIFATVMGSTWVAVGSYGAYRGATTDPWYIIALSLIAIVYGALWLNTARTGKWGKIPLWP
jgi:hypothetical protein